MKKQHWFFIIFTIITFLTVHTFVYYIAQKDVVEILDKLKNENISLQKYELKYEGVSLFWGDKILEKQYLGLRLNGNKPIFSLVFSAIFKDYGHFRIEWVPLLGSKYVTPPTMEHIER